MTEDFYFLQDLRVEALDEIEGELFLLNIVIIIIVELLLGIVVDYGGV